MLVGHRDQGEVEQTGDRWRGDRTVQHRLQVLPAGQRGAGGGCGHRVAGAEDWQIEGWIGSILAVAAVNSG